MRVRFRILLFRGGKALRKRDLLSRKDPLGLGMRYILEFKYLEASKWLLLAEDSWEKYTLLALINLALGQKESAEEFLLQARSCSRVTDLKIAVKGETGEPVEVERFTDPAQLSG